MAQLLATLGASAVTFSFDLKQLTANYVQVVEFSTDQEFTTPILLDTIDGNTNLGVWIAKTYTLTDGEEATFTDDCYFRIRKLRPSPAGTNGGANSTYHVYDNLEIAVETGPGTPFEITEIIHDSGTDMLTLTWMSIPGEEFIVRYSRDLADWDGPTDGDLEDGIPAAAGAEETTMTFDLSPPGLENEARVYFRVELQDP